MKLYTEEQLLNTIKSVRHYADWFGDEVADERIEKHLKALAPIELPTDEEIYNEAKCIEKNIKILPFDIASFQYGAKWVIEQINNLNNKQWKMLTAAAM